MGQSRLTNDKTSPGGEELQEIGRIGNESANEGMEGATEVLVHRKMGVMASHSPSKEGRHGHVFERRLYRQRCAASG